MTKIDLNNLDKSSWESFKFEEIAFKISESVNPNKTDLGVYIGLEHIDAEDIHIRRTGTPDDVNGQKLKCYPGDVIFGKRRAYQRKAAIVAVEGICSAHAFVLRANKDNIDPKLFPFFLHSDQFMHCMIDISVGGLSPTINWGDLKHQEFLLPPIEEQKEIAELLWAMDDVIEKEKKIIKELRKNDLSRLKYFFHDDKKSTRIKLKNIIKLKKGKTPSLLLEKGDGIPYCTAKYLRSGEIESIVPNELVSKLTLIDESDILVLWDGSNAGEMLLGKKGILASTMCKLDILDKNFKKEFIYAFLRFKNNDIKRATVGSAIPHVDPGMINNIGIPKLTLKQQDTVINILSSLNESINNVNVKLQSLQFLQKSLINQIF